MNNYIFGGSTSINPVDPSIPVAITIQPAAAIITSNTVLPPNGSHGYDFCNGVGVTFLNQNNYSNNITVTDNYYLVDQTGSYNPNNPNNATINYYGFASGALPKVQFTASYNPVSVSMSQTFIAIY